MKILLIKGRSQYNALRAFLDDAKKGFEANGHEVVLLDLVDDEINAGFQTLAVAMGPFDLAFSYVIMGDWRSRSGQSVGELINAPHIIQHVDHPFSHLDRVQQTDPKTAILLIDQSHADVVKSVFGNDHFAYVGFNPHAAIGEPALLSEDADAYVQSRPISFFFAGTYYRPDRDNAPWKPLPENVQAVFIEATEMALAHNWLPPHVALAEAMAARGLPVDDPSTRALMRFCHLIHEQVRRHRRYEFLKMAAKVKLPMTVYGNGYDKDLYRFKTMDYRGPADFHEIIAQMRQSRVVMNVNVNFCEGSHERPLCAMLAGAVCASEASTFYNTNFDVGVNSGEMTCFNWSTLEADLIRIRGLAQSPQMLLDMARSAQSKVVANHTWKSRAKRIVEIAGMVRRSPQWAK